MDRATPVALPKLQRCVLRRHPRYRSARLLQLLGEQVPKGLLPIALVKRGRALLLAIALVKRGQGRARPRPKVFVSRV